MAFLPPVGVIPVDRKSPSVALYTDIPALLDWLRIYYPAHTVIGTFVTARDQKISYRVDAEPAYGTPGTLVNYTLTQVDWNRAEVGVALADITQTKTAATAAIAKLAGFTFKVFSPAQVINGVSAVLAIADSSGNTAAYWDINGTMYAPGGVIGPLTALTASITTATIATLTATAATLGGSQFTVLGSGYVGTNRAGLVVAGADGSVPFYIDLTGTVYAPGGLNVSNLVVTGNLSLAALTAAAATLGGSQFSLASGTRYVNGTLAQNVIQDAAGNVISYFGPDGMFYAPGGISAPNAVPGLGLAADGRVLINGMKMISSRNMVMWGDSLTAGSGASNTITKSVLGQTLTLLNDGRTATNQGLGGNQAQHIAARAAALPTYVTVVGGSIPATVTAVEVTPSIRLLDGSGIRTRAVTIAGVAGILSHDNTTVQAQAAPYYFTRTTAGNAVAVSGSSLATLDNSATADDLHVIWAGTNDLGYSDTAGIVARVQGAIRALVDNIRTPSKRFAVLTIIPGSRLPNDPNAFNALYYTQMLQINAWIAATYPSNFVDVTTPLITYGGNTDGSVPASLRIDIIHMNDTGYGVVAAELNKFILWKGY
ncbi:SGNH/GDSL hydrolase family protein [Deinococcus oregonensis]|uniref:SGNH/GDSL hydrolase family protein n=1 Tax=Deinococcus oregonensis TaxID=1805970 RepID=A0ABV6B2T3_9DEIO